MTLLHQQMRSLLRQHGYDKVLRTVNEASKYRYVDAYRLAEDELYLKLCDGPWVKFSDNLLIGDKATVLFELEAMGVEKKGLATC